MTALSDHIIDLSPWGNGDVLLATDEYHALEGVNYHNGRMPAEKLLLVNSFVLNRASGYFRDVLSAGHRERWGRSIQISAAEVRPGLPVPQLMTECPVVDCRGDNFLPLVLLMQMLHGYYNWGQLRSFQGTIIAKHKDIWEMVQLADKYGCMDALAESGQTSLLLGEIAVVEEKRTKQWRSDRCKALPSGGLFFFADVQGDELLPSVAAAWALNDNANFTTLATVLIYNLRTPLVELARGPQLPQDGSTNPHYDSWISEDLWVQLDRVHDAEMARLDYFKESYESTAALDPTCQNCQWYRHHSRLDPANFWHGQPRFHLASTMWVLSNFCCRSHTVGHEHEIRGVIKENFHQLFYAFVGSVRDDISSIIKLMAEQAGTPEQELSGEPLTNLISQSQNLTIDELVGTLD
ncbi:hypothetical protein BT63DRAFT_477055 [Microthyrium microscopicum]|uniref:BTB domain-containing protein n=1 Tax=Microthyrium microscopicum TaxID=703497 RepID=A0A6A6UKP3_9PEZI|nr:hypothetical protein BT63DRAFT_477055 [Microthyrium microscopicum]